MPSEDKRKKVSNEARAEAMDRFRDKLLDRLQQKGQGTFASRHEVLGVLQEEFAELVTAVQGNNVEEFEEELIDIMVGAYWGLASSKNKTLDW